MTDSIPPAAPRHKSALRKPLARFVGVMEYRLRQHDDDRGRRGWSKDSAFDLVRRLKEELLELEAGLIGDAAFVGEYVERIENEAADVANFAMMIADVTRLGATRRPNG